MKSAVVMVSIAPDLAEGVRLGTGAGSEGMVSQGERHQGTHTRGEVISGNGQTAIASHNGMNTAFQAVAEPVESLAFLLGNALRNSVLHSRISRG